MKTVEAVDDAESGEMDARGPGHARVAEQTATAQFQ